jgi:hypothetical protein
MNGGGIFLSKRISGEAQQHSCANQEAHQVL